MATLPRSPIANNVTNNYRPVAQARASGADPVGQALGQAGDAGFEIASRMADAKIATQAAQVELELENRLDQERRALEDDNEVDPASLEAMFQERASKAVSEIGGKISSPALKRAFGMKSAETVQRNTFQVRDVSRRKQVDLARGEFVTTMDAYSKTYDEPSNYLTPKGYDTSPAQDRLASQQSLIKAQVRAGIIDSETAALQSIKAQDAYALGLQNKHLKAIDDALESGDYSGADSYFMANSGDFTTPEMREKTRDIIQTKRREGESITVADDIWTKSGENYSEFLRLIREDPRVKGTEMLTAVEARGATRKNQGDAAKAVEQDAVVNEALLALNDTGSVPSSVLRRADGKTREFIQDQLYQRQVRARESASMSAEQRRLAREASDASAKYIASVGGDPEMAEMYLAGPAAWKEEAPWLYEQYTALDTVDRAAIESDINKRRTSGGTATASDKVFAELIKSVPMLAPDNSKYGDGRSKKGKPAAEIQAVQASLRQQADEYSARTGGALLTVDERNKMVARAFREADPKRYPYPEPGAMFGRISRTVVNSPAYQATRSVLASSLGREPTEAEVMATMQALEREP